MKRKCPWCGSKDVAEYLWGLPAFSEQLVQDMADGKIILGGCCITGNDPSAHCNACGNDFGRPPYLQGKKGQATDELYPDVLIGIGFSIGGYFGGHDVVEITTDENGHHSVYKHYPETTDSADISYTMDLTDAQWERLMDTLFRKLCVHEWKQRYVNPHVCDGTQWRLELKLTGGRRYSICGSNDFPALYNDLVRAFKPYMLKEREELFHATAEDWIPEEEFRQEEKDRILEELRKKEDDLFERAVLLAISKREITASMLQMSLRIGYARASRIVDEMEKRKFISAKDGSKPRKCLITMEQWKAMKAAGR